MKVRDLIDLLSTLDQEAEVILSSDAEGNSYSPLASYDTGVYAPNSTWSGDFYSTNDVVDEDEDADDEDDEDDEDCGPPDNAIPAVVLWPTN